MKFKRITIVLVALLIVVMSVIGVYQEFDEFFCKWDYEAYSIPKERSMAPMYLVKNIELAENGNILIGAKHGIFMFKNNGKCVAFLQIEDKFRFKVEGENLIIIGDYRQNLCSYDNYKINADSLKEDKDSYKEIKMYYKDYCDKNGFENSKTVKKGDAEYEYNFYGKVKVTENGKSKVINLERKWYPLPYEYILIIDGTLLFAFVVFKVVKIVRKREKQKEL